MPLQSIQDESVQLAPFSLKDLEKMDTETPTHSLMLLTAKMTLVYASPPDMLADLETFAASKAIAWPLGAEVGGSCLQLRKKFDFMVAEAGGPTFVIAQGIQRIIGTYVALILCKAVVESKCETGGAGYLPWHSTQYASAPSPLSVEVLAKGQELSKSYREAWAFKLPDIPGITIDSSDVLPSQRVIREDLEAEYRNYLIGQGRILEEISDSPATLSSPSPSTAGSRSSGVASTSFAQARRNSWSLGSWLSSYRLKDSAARQKVQNWKEMASVWQSYDLPGTLEAALASSSLEDRGHGK